MSIDIISKIFRHSIRYLKHVQFLFNEAYSSVIKNSRLKVVYLANIGFAFPTWLSNTTHFNGGNYLSPPRALNSGLNVGQFRVTLSHAVKRHICRLFGVRRWSSLTCFEACGFDISIYSYLEMIVCHVNYTFSDHN
jgi:hypothetical protein